jgi:murein DD-endopeptidase MepM/ murein hydrolase activator NlpD
MSRSPRLLVAVLSTLVLVWGAVGPASTPANAAGTPRFLSLPFKVVPGMRIQQGFVWVGPGHVPNHGGIDYILGRRDRSATWKSFPVYAAASGRACANLTGRPGCIKGVGNRVLITHTINGRKYRSYYGHLRAISKRIPMGGRTVFVKRGELLGYAGYSGDPCCVTHLHFQLFDPQWRIVDPYGINSTRSAYPDPAGRNGIRNGRRSYWVTDPPSPPPTFTWVPVRKIPYPS